MERIIMTKNKQRKAASTLLMNEKGLKSNYGWHFKPYFRAKAFGWRGSQLAIKRIKEALKEINNINKTNKILAAEGAIYLMSRFWLAFQHIDTSTGSLGNAVNLAMEKLLTIIIQAPASLIIRQHWLDILWQILQDDGVDYVAEISDKWGELAGFPEEASRRADEFSFIVKMEWESNRSAIHFDAAYLSALFFAKRYDEIMEIIEKAPYPSWRINKFGAMVLALTDINKAIAYAEQARHAINAPQLSIDEYCETVLIDSGQSEEAYKRYAISANQANTYMNWFNRIKKKYRAIKSDQQILFDLIDAKVTEPGKWFSVANKLKQYDLAIKLIQKSPADPKTLNRAAKASLEENPSYALKVALFSLQWMVMGYGYEISNFDVFDALDTIDKSAQVTHQTKTAIRKLIEIANTDTSGFYSPIILTHLKTNYSEKGDNL
jgi:hypothetical protein